MLDFHRIAAQDYEANDDTYYYRVRKMPDEETWTLFIYRPGQIRPTEVSNQFATMTLAKAVAREYHELGNGYEPHKHSNQSRFVQAIEYAYHPNRKLPAPLTDERLAEIEARANAALRGPWEVNYDCYYIHEQPCSCTEHAGAIRTPDPRDSVRERAERDGEPVPDYGYSRKALDDFDKATVEFIAAARQDVPDLLAEVHGLRAVVEAGTAAVPRPASSSGHPSLGS